MLTPRYFNFLFPQLKLTLLSECRWLRLFSDFSQLRWTVYLQPISTFHSTVSLMLNLKLTISGWQALLALTEIFGLSVAVLVKKFASSDVSILWVVRIAITFLCSRWAVDSEFAHGILSAVGWLALIAGFPLKVVSRVSLNSTSPSLSTCFAIWLAIWLVFKVWEQLINFADLNFWH